HPFVNAAPDSCPALLQLVAEAIGKIESGMLHHSDSEAEQTDDEERSVNDLQYDRDEKELDLTLKQGNLYLLDTPIAKDDMAYDDTIRPDQVQFFKKEQQQLQRDPESKGPVEPKPAPESTTSVSPPKSGDPSKNSPSPQMAWPSFFGALPPDALQQLFEMVERNEAREIQSIRNEFQPKLEPILDGIAYRRLQYAQMKK
ncbi:hypothetical protein HDU91_004224, partial [Kappamyces sp. JEL0680]